MLPARLITLTALLLASTAVASPQITGFNRFHNPTTNALAAGTLLLTELHCTACHQPDLNRHPHLAHQPAPNLLKSRFRPGFIRQWLTAPHQVKPGTRMPDLLAGHSLPERLEIAAQLEAALPSTDPPPAPEPSPPANLAQGRELFDRIGCAACHAVQSQLSPTLSENPPHRSPLLLPHLRSKYSFTNLVEFLLDPLSIRPSGRMPRTPMTPQEAHLLSAYLLHLPRPESVPTPQPHLASAGNKRFNQLGCANCHSIHPNPAPPSPAKSLANLAHTHNSGCLSEHPVKGIPFYNLTVNQRQALRFTLDHLASSPSPTPSQLAQLRMTSLNCFACHQRDGIGGIQSSLQDLFQTSGEDLGDEGRFPPPLTGVGRKLSPTALQQILQGQNPIRPFMNTRMPDFGPDHAAMLTDLLAKADADPAVTPTPRHGRENEVGRNMWGRSLIGTDGLSCITCHPLAGHKSLGIQSVDLATAPHRLQPEWFRDYLIDPAQFRPGTRMPSFWPDGKPALKKFINSTERQIDSLWVYLSELDQSRLPAGLEPKGSFELFPTHQPIVFRTFMQHAGLHAVAVGFPQHLHAAFDAQDCRWAVLWKGRFLDAESTWDDRFTPLTKPLGTNLLLLPEEFPFNTSPPRKLPHTFSGYRLNQAGTPTLLYQYGSWHIEDRMEPATDAKSLIQSIRITGPPGNLAYRLPPLEGIELLSPNGIISTTNQTRTVHVQKTEPPVILTLKWTW